MVVTICSMCSPTFFNTVMYLCVCGYVFMVHSLKIGCLYCVYIQIQYMEVVFSYRVQNCNSRQLQLCSMSVQGIINPTGKETQQFFSRMFVTAKKNKELFASTLNEIAASVRRMSLALVVLSPRFLGWLRKKTKNDGVEPTNIKTVMLFQSEHKHFTPVAVLTMYVVTSLSYFSMIYASQ